MTLDAPLYDLLNSGATFADVEEWINSLDCSPVQKDVLWLLAWSETPRWYVRQRRRELLAETAVVHD